MPVHAFPGVFGAQYNSVSRSNTGYTSQGTCTTSGTKHTDVTPVQLVASTPFDTTAIHLRVITATASSGVRCDATVEVMIGGAGSETSLIGPVLIGYQPANGNLFLPIYIPAGSRLSYRVRGERLSVGYTACIDLYGQPNRDMPSLPQRWTSYGLVTDANNSRGTIVVPGASNAWGSWTSLTTSTTYSHSLWVPMIDGGTATAITAVTRRSQFAIARTTDAATMVTNGTVYDGPIWVGTTSEVINHTLTGAAWVVGGPFIIYDPKPDGSSVSCRMMNSGAVDSNGQGAAILAAVM